MALPKLVVELAAKIREYMADLDKAATATEASAARIERADKTIADAAKDAATGQATMADTAVQVASRMGPVGGAVAAAAAVVAGYAVVSYKAAQENTALVKALALSGNQAGVTAGQLQGVAAAASQVVGTHGQAAQAIGLMVSGGKVAGENLQALTVTALNASRTLGIGVQDTVKHYEALADSPAKASAKLNQAMGYLNAETYRRIQALEEMGRKDEAAALAQQTYARGVDDAAKKVEASLGTLQRGWRNVGEAAGKAWDWMLGLGRKDEVQDSLAGLRQKLDEKERQLRAGFATTGGGAAVGMRGMSDDRRGQLEAEAEGLREQIRLMGRAGATAAANAAASARYQKEGIEWADKAAAAEERLKSNATKRAEAIAKADEALRDGHISTVKHAALVADAEQRYADKATKGAKAASDDFARMGAEIQKQLDLANEQLVVGRQLTASEKFRIDTLSKIDEALRKQNITQAQAIQLQKDMAVAAAARDAVDDKARRIKIDQALFAQQVQNMEDEAAYNVARSKAWEQSQLALVAYNQSVMDQIDLTQVELGLAGQTQQSRDLALTYYRIELELKKQIRAIDESSGYDTEADRELARARARATAAKARLNAETQSQVTEWNRVFDQVENGLTDALMRGFEAGKSMFANLRDYSVNLFKSMVLRPVVQAITSPVAGAITSSLGLAGAANAGTSALTGAASSAAGSALLGGASLTSMGQYFATGFMNTVAGTGAATGAAAGSAIGGASGTAMQVGAYAPYAIAAVAALAAVGAFRTTKTVGGGLMGTLGEGGQVDAYDLRRKSGYLFGGPDYSISNKGVAEQNKPLQDAFIAMRTATSGMADALGLGGDAIKTFATTIGKELIHPDTGGLGLKFDGLTPEQSAAKVQAALAAANDEMAALVLGTTEYTRTGETASQTLARLSNSLTTVNATWDALGFTLDAVSLSGAAASSGFVDLMGGLENFTAATAGYFANFHTEAERADFATEQLAAQLAALGQTMPATRDGFRALVEAAEQAGNDKLLAGLLNLQDEFAALVPAADKAATAVSSVLSGLQSTGKSLQREIIELQGGDVRAFDIQGFTVNEVAAYDLNTALTTLRDGLKASKTAAAETADTQKQAAADTLAAWKSAQQSAAQGWLDGATTLQNARYEQDTRALDAARQAEQAIGKARTSAAQAQVDAVSGIAGVLRNAYQSMTGLASQPLTTSTYRAARSVVDQAAATGNLSQAGLEDALKVVSGDTTQLFGRFEDWAMAQAAAADPVGKLDAQAQGQMAAAQAIIDTMRLEEEAAAARYEEEKRTLGDQHDQQMSMLQAQYEAQVMQIDATMQLGAAIQAQAQAAAAAAQANSIAVYNQANSAAEAMQRQGQLIQTSLADAARMLMQASGGSMNYDQAMLAASQGGKLSTENGLTTYVMSDGRRLTAPTGSADANRYKTLYEETNRLTSLIQDETGAYLFKGIETQINDYKRFIDSASYAPDGYTQSGLTSFMQSRGINMAALNPVHGSALTDLLKQYGLKSYDVGINRLPSDQLAFLHKDEAVVPAQFNPFNPNASQPMGSGNAEVVAELRAINKRMASVEASTLANAGFAAAIDRKLARVTREDITQGAAA